MNEQLHAMYNNMKQRCYNRNHPQYRGGLGMFLEWLNDENIFHKWAYANGFNPAKRITRMRCIDPRKEYGPDNIIFTMTKKDTVNAAPPPAVKLSAIENHIGQKLILDQALGIFFAKPSEEDILAMIDSI